MGARRCPPLAAVRRSFAALAAVTVLAGLVSGYITSVTYPYGPRILADTGVTPLQLGLALAAKPLVSTPLSFAAGALIARVGSFWPLLLSLLGDAAGAVLLAALPGSFAVVVVARCLMGVCDAALINGIYACAGEQGHSRRIALVSGLVLSAMLAGQAVGPAVGGVMLANVGYSPALYLGAALAGLDLVLRVVLVPRHPIAGIGPGGIVLSPPPPAAAATAAADETTPLRATSPPAVATAPSPTPKPSSSPPQSLSTRLQCRHMFSSALSLCLIVAEFGVGVISSLLFTVVPLYLEREQHMGSSGTGAVLGAAALFTVLTALLTGWLADFTARHLLFVVVGMCCAGPLALIIPLGGASIAATVFCLMPFVIALTMGGTPLFASFESAANKRGVTPALAFGTISAVYSLAQAVGPISGGAMVPAIDMRGMSYVVGAVVAVGGICVGVYFVVELCRARRQRRSSSASSGAARYTLIVEEADEGTMARKQLD